MAELKTKKTTASVDEFIATVEDAKKRADCERIMAMMAEVTSDEPSMWGSSIVGFGSYHYRYASGREGTWFLTGFSPRKRNLTLYIMSGFAAVEDLLPRLGKYSTGKSCLYVTRLMDVDFSVLRAVVEVSVKHLRDTYSE